MSGAGRIVAGAEYVEQISASASDHRYRQRFQGLALQLTKPGESLLDFGSGPGIDARFYAEHGRRVWVYDIDPRMHEYLDGYCRDLIASGTVMPLGTDYREFLAGASLAPAARVALITSNFAPLNLVSDLRELFARFDSLASPSGAVLASVLSPYFAGDLRYGWWWRNVGRLWKHGRFAVPGAQALIWRRRLRDFAAQCTPYFTLESVFPGNHIRLPARTPGTWLHLTTCRFMFLLFRRRHAGPAADVH